MINKNFIRNILPQILMISIICTSCGKSSKAEEKKHSDEYNAVASINELPMPVIPDSITDPIEKRIYAGMHYWDPLNFNDTIKSLDDAFMEQSFANFTVILGLQPDETSLRNAFAKMLEKASVEPKALTKVEDIVKLYLADPNSPMRSEELWIAFLEVVTADNRYADETENLRYQFELEMAKKNRPGMKAKDFKYITKDGVKSSLYNTPVGSEGLILIFYDPECDHCKEIISALNQNPQIAQWIENKTYTVLAVDIAEDQDQWEKTLDKMPNNWIVGYNTDGVEDRDLYYFPALPVIYILGSDYIVKEKDVKI